MKKLRPRKKPELLEAVTKRQKKYQEEGDRLYRFKTYPKGIGKTCQK